MMNQVSAADNLTIEFVPGNWLLRNGDASAPMLYASAEGLRYNSYFATTRRLPPTGVLPIQDLVQVVVGWQASDEAWHLGMVLAPELATQRESRWCELAHWPDPERNVFEDLAQQTGAELARTLHVPFYMIPPQPAEPPPPPPPLPVLPLTVGLWTLQSAFSTLPMPFATHQEMLILQQARRWRDHKYRRIIWYAIWMMIYAWISVATLTANLALPNAGTLLPDPHVLPYFGIVIALVVFPGLILYTLHQLRTQPDTIVIDPHTRTISAWRGNHPLWTLPTDTSDAIQSVYVSEIVRRKVKDTSTEHGEINLHLGNGQFHFVFQQGEHEANAWQPRHDPTPPKPNSDEVQHLTRYQVVSSLQAMGVYIGEALGNLPIWYDVRVR
jgi:hypothetical protein